MNATSTALPALLGGAYAGTLTSGTYLGSTSSDTYSLNYANYNYGTGALGAPTPVPGSGNVYAEVSFLLTSAANGGQAWLGTAQNMSLTIPTIAAKSSVAVRMWEGGGPNLVPVPMCLNQTAANYNASGTGYVFTATVGSGGAIAFPSALQASTIPTSALTACAPPNYAGDLNINPIFGIGGGLWIMVTDN